MLWDFFFLQDRQVNFPFHLKTLMNRPTLFQPLTATISLVAVSPSNSRHHFHTIANSYEKCHSLCIYLNLYLCNTPAKGSQLTVMTRATGKLMGPDMDKHVKWRAAKVRFWCVLKGALRPEDRKKEHYRCHQNKLKPFRSPKLFYMAWHTCNIPIIDPHLHTGGQDATLSHKMHTWWFTVAVTYCLHKTDCMSW